MERFGATWNGTEDDIAADLVAAGVPKSDIVLGFQSPFMRQFTEYARLLNGLVEQIVFVR